MTLIAHELFLVKVLRQLVNDPLLNFSDFNCFCLASITLLNGSCTVLGRKSPQRRLLSRLFYLEMTTVLVQDIGKGFTAGLFWVSFAGAMVRLPTRGLFVAVVVVLDHDLVVFT